jgi:hypothetical protein
MLRPMPGLTRISARLLPAAAATFILLLPAAWNRFALLEWDTGGYLARWFEGTLVPSRSTTYGLFLAASAPLQFWPALVLQAAAAVWIIALVLRVHEFSAQRFALPAIIAALSAVTALPWLASVLLTDIFAGLAVLALHILICLPDRVSARERLGLVLFIGFAGSTHSATYAVLLGLILVALAVSWRLPVVVPRATLPHGIAAIVLGAVFLLAGNYIVARQIAWTPGGYGIAFARMLQDGIVTRYLNDHCPDPRLRLCPYRNQLPLDADEFLWGNNSVFDKLGRFEGLGDEMRTIVIESLRDYPATQIKAALVATAKQLVTVGTGEGINANMWHTYGIIEHFTPYNKKAMRAAHQQHNDLNFKLIDKVHIPVAWAAMALLPLLIVLGWRNAAFADVAVLATTIALSLLGNAAVCGIISNPHDRYGARIVWIAAFAVAMATWRAAALTRHRWSGLRPAASSPAAS